MQVCRVQNAHNNDYCYFYRPFTYDIHTEALNVLLVLLSSQIYSGDPATSVVVKEMMSVSQ